MPKRITVFFVAFVAFSSGAQADAEMVPPAALTAGSQYQLIFVTADTITATSPLIGTYNSFAAAEAAPLASLVPAGVTWSAVVSSADGTAAYVNAPSSGVPVYNTAGVEVATSSIYSGGLLNPVLYDQNGNQDLTTSAWTGSLPDGTPYSPYYLDSPTSFAITGLPTSAGGAWIAQNSPNIGTDQSLYVLSSVITVPSPEPSTVTLLGSAFSLLAGYHLLKRRKVA